MLTLHQSLRPIKHFLPAIPLRIAGDMAGTHALGVVPQHCSDVDGCIVVVIPLVQQLLIFARRQVNPVE